MIKTIIFDAGHVLFETDFKKINKIIKKKYGVTTLVYSSDNKKAIKEYIRETEGKGSMEKVFELLGAKKKDLPEIMMEYERMYIKYKIINKKLLRLIKKLKKDYQLICLTDTHKIHFDANIKINFFKDFNKVFASHLQKIKKENKKAFKKVLRELKIKPKEALFIDDNKINIKNAKELGINTILYIEFPKISKLKKEIYNKLKCNKNVNKSF